MKIKNIFFTAALIYCSVVSAQKIEVKQCWSRPAAKSGQLESFGLYRDQKNIILALRVPGLQKLISGRGHAGIYWNCDNDINTGRFSGKQGVDIQFNINFRKKTFDVIHWQGNSRSNLAVNASAGLRLDNDTAVISLPPELFNAVKIAERSTARIVLLAGKKQSDAVKFTITPAAEDAPAVCFAVQEKPESVAVDKPVSGKGIAVPVCLERKGMIKAAGIYRDDKKTVFGFVMPAIAPDDALLLYWNSDNNINTGRFPGRLGVDIQFNFTLDKKQLKVVVHEFDKNHGKLTKRSLTVYEDDYLIEEKNGVLFIAFKNETMASVKVNNTGFLEAVYRHNRSGERFIINFDFDRPGKKYLPQNLDFVRFGSVQKMRNKTAKAIPLKKFSSSVSVWDCGSERFAENEAAPAFAPAVEHFEMKAAKNESERLFFAVENRDVIKTMNIKTGNFRNTDGKVLKADNFYIRYADFVINDRNEKVTDILLPEFPGHQVKRQFVMLGTKVPANAAPGVYFGALELSVNGKTAGKIPVRLEVFNFLLPEKSALPTAFAIKRSRVSERFRDRRTALSLTEQLLEQARRMRYGVRLMRNEPKVKLVNGKLQIDWNAYEQEKRTFHRSFPIAQHTHFQLGSHDQFIRWNSILKKQYKDAEDPEFKSVWEQFVKASYSWHKSNGLMDKTLFIIWDEPYTRWNDIISAAKVIRKHAPDMPIGIFIDRYQPLLEKYIDIWLVGAPAIAWMRTAPGMENKRVWFYNTVGMRNFRRPAADLRGYYLLAFKYNIEGLLYSAINCLNYISYKDGYYHNDYPNHTWMYADNSGKQIFDSWRQHLTADGLDDFDYLKLYKSALEKQGRKLPAWLTDKFPSFGKSGEIVFKIDTVADWNTLRERIARELSK